MSSHELHYKREGDSSENVVLFIHGMIASGRFWGPLIKEMNIENYITIDLLGFGESPKPKNASYSLDQHLKKIESILKKEKIGSYSIIGHSMGSLLALHLAVRAKKSVRNVILASPIFYSNTKSAKHYLKKRNFIMQFLLDGPLAFATCKTVCQIPVVVTITDKLNKKLPRFASEDAYRHIWESYSRTYRNVIFAQNNETALSKIKVPVKVICPTEDRLLERDYIKKLTKNHNLFLVEPIGDHLMYLLEPTDSAAAIRKLL